MNSLLQSPPRSSSRTSDSPNLPERAVLESLVARIAEEEKQRAAKALQEDRARVQFQLD